MEQQNNDKITIMSVSFNSFDNKYGVELARGSSVSETAFAMAVVIKCLLKDGVIQNSTEITDLINKYLTDPQYEELKETRDDK